jgi:hypothetical protein
MLNNNNLTLFGLHNKSAIKKTTIDGGVFCMLRIEKAKDKRDNVNPDCSVSLTQNPSADRMERSSV